MLAIAVVFLLQVAGLVTGTKAIATRSVYPQETRVHLPVSGSDLAPASMEPENPFLFASAGFDGFSGIAWLRKPDWEPTVPTAAAPIRFLGYREARQAGPAKFAGEPFAFSTRPRAQAVFTPPAGVELDAPRASRLEVTGLEDRALVSPMPLPPQFHSDILTRSLVEVLVGQDGLVISARVIENSGSPKADAEALALTKMARFEPGKAGRKAAAGPQTAKLIFDWHTLALSGTNSVPR